MIAAYRKNCMGTVSFQAQFKGARKPTEFIVYPIKSDDDASTILIQSDTRIGRIHLTSGKVLMTKSISSGAYGCHLAQATVIDQLNTEDLFILKAHIFATAGSKVGTNGVIHCDNAGAEGCLGVSA